MKFQKLIVRQVNLLLQIFMIILKFSAQDVTTTECTELVHVDVVAVTEYLESVQLDYKGMCGHRALRQQQQVDFGLGVNTAHC